MSNIYKVACAQLSPIFLNKKKCVEKAIDAIHEASKNNAKLIVFPEAFIPGYPDWIWLLPNSKSAELNELYVRLMQNSVSVPGEEVDALCEAAKNYEINVVIGINERNTAESNGSIYNSLLFIDDKGKLSGTHRKLIPTGGERLVWSRGDGKSLIGFNSSVGKIGGLICWENFMPLARVALYQQGIQILASPTWDKSENWRLSMQHIAREGGVYVISSCMTLHMKDIPDELAYKVLYPDGREWINQGNSCIVDPSGKIIAGPLSEKEGLLYADVDPTMIIKAKRMFDVAGHYSRPDVFDLKINR